MISVGKKICLFVAVLFTIFSCKKEILPKEPVITLISASPLSVIQFKDSIEIRFSYKDNNGDIGDESPDDYSVEVKDSRLSKPDYYHIQPLTPDLNELKIEGELKVKIHTMFLLGGTSETVILSIKLKDREGNWSNTIETPAITIY